MTVKELMEILQELPQDMEVVITDGHEIMWTEKVTIVNNGEGFEECAMIE